MNNIPELSGFFSLISLLYFMAGLSVLKFQPGRRMNQMFFAACACFALWALSHTFAFVFPAGRAAEGFRGIFLFAGALGASFMLHFFYHFSGTGKRASGRYLLPLAYLPATAFFPLEISGATADPARGGPSTAGFYILWHITAVLICMGLTYRQSRNTPGVQDRSRARVIIGSGSASAVIAVLSAAVLSRSGPAPPELLLPAMLIWTGGVWHAFSQHRMMTLRDAAVSENILDTTTEAIILTNETGGILSANPAALRLLGYTWDELVSADIKTIFPEGMNRPEDIEGLMGEPVYDIEYALVRKGGSRIPAILSSSPISGLKDRARGTVFLFSDITGLKNTELLLRQRVEFEQLVAGISTSFINLDLSEVDSEIQKALGKIGEFAKADRAYILVFSDDYKFMTNTHEWCAEGIAPQIGKLKSIPVEGAGWDSAREKLMRLEPLNIPGVSDIRPEAEALRKHLESQDIKSLVCVPMAFGRKLTGLIGFDSVKSEREWTGEEVSLLRITGEIITNSIERKRAEGILRASELKYRDLWDNAPVAYHIIDTNGRILEVNSTESRMLGYAKEEMIGRHIFDFVLPPQRESAQRRFREKLSGRAVPQIQDRVYLRKDGSKLYVSVHDFLECDESGAVKGIRTAMINITKRKQAEDELQATYSKIERSFEDMVLILARIAELRDPYTAGHGRRVSRLACIIAKKLGMDDETIKGIRLASTIHDIGKIYVPVEILAKPSTLTELEFNIVKIHPSIAFDILKEIEFPWPIAEIVHQHHERLNGSGYPLGLEEEGILKEAKILGVCDVVESMTSFRPYRSGLGIEKALEEIALNKGRLYDPEVAEVCFELFGEWEFNSVFSKEESPA